MSKKIVKTLATYKQCVHTCSLALASLPPSLARLSLADNPWPCECGWAETVARARQILTDEARLACSALQCQASLPVTSREESVAPGPTLALALALAAVLALAGGILACKVFCHTPRPATTATVASQQKLFDVFLAHCPEVRTV